MTNAAKFIKTYERNGQDGNVWECEANGNEIHCELGNHEDHHGIAIDRWIYIVEGYTVMYHWDQWEIHGKKDIDFCPKKYGSPAKALAAAKKEAAKTYLGPIPCSGSPLSRLHRSK
mgnify:FL=1